MNQKILNLFHSFGSISYISLEDFEKLTVVFFFLFFQKIEPVFLVQRTSQRIINIVL